MRLVAVSIVKNEADIIEAFVRHTLAWTDHHLVLDHDSTDGTREALVALRREGLPLSLFTDDLLGNLQQARSNHLTALAATEHGADWILPLDADEFLDGPSRADLEACLRETGGTRPASLGLLNYYPTTDDDAHIANPAVRLRYCQTIPPRTRKVLIPRSLALDSNVKAGKGSHALYRGADAQPDDALPVAFRLAHLALRSPEHQVLRVVLAELQKLSRGRAHEGLDLHYRLGFQLLAENPRRFLDAVFRPPDGLRLEPIAYRGGPMRHSGAAGGWERVARALLPYLEKLAASHGRLLDGEGTQIADPSAGELLVRALPATDAPPAGVETSEPFEGFVATAGWGEQEGPVPEAFLPPFHWGIAPATELVVTSPPQSAKLVAEMLTYSEGQAMSVELNGSLLCRHVFGAVNQKESLIVPLPLRGGENRLVLRYERSLTTDFDPRPLAVIFLSLQVRAAGEM